MTDLAAANTALRSQRLRRRAVSAILEETDEVMRRGARPGARVWPTGLDELDRHLGGGLRSGELILMAGAQSKGKTTIGLQMLRNAVVGGGTGIIFSFEHQAHTLIERLIALEAAEVAAASGLDYEPSEIAGVQEVREAFERSVGGGASLDVLMAEIPFGLQGLANVMGYAHRLHIHESNQGTTVEEIRAVIDEVAQECEDEPVVLVDYLQKVPAARSDEMARITYVAESLKNLALTCGIPVIAIASADKENLGAGQRMRSHHLRGSSSLAYEADVVLVVADKADIVSREHLVYDLNAAKVYAEWSVVTVEKNRNGTAHGELEFPKDFAHARVVPFGREVSERLVEERVFTS